MLVAASLPNYDGPKIISGIRKRDILSPTPIRPNLTGDLLVQCGSEKTWWPRRVTVRGGQLIVSTKRPDDSLPTLRLPLRHLSLQAGPLSNSVALCRGSIVVLTIQASSEQFFELWVKVLAIELIRQTPLFAVKYFDILNLAEECKKRDQETKKNLSSHVIKQEKPETAENNANGPSGIEEKAVENLLKKCQNVENYVPVKEKLVLFESLCRLGRKVRSTEDVSYNKMEIATKRAISMHDLSNLNSHIAVREICKYFESKTTNKVEDTSKTNSKTHKRLIYSDPFPHIQKYSKVLLR